MIKVLIPTKPDDAHAIYVKLALDKYGHKADLWYTSDFPTMQTHSFEVIRNKTVWDVGGVDSELNKEYNIVWFRRPSKPILPHFLHVDDVENAKKENMTFFQTFWQVIAPNAIWINPVNNVTRVNSKLLQLQIAANVGLNIPHTLISNDPVKIKKYINQNQGNVIYKTLYPMAWLKKDTINLTYTDNISPEDLPCDLILQSTPGIFQEKIDKKYELRVTFFGNEYIAAKIHSQNNVDAKNDWRAATTSQLLLEQITLPSEIVDKCRKLMRRFNILFGCFDFIVTSDNKYYFLEVNEQGQFLWIEDVNPDIKMLEAFVNFLISQGSQVNKPVSNVQLSDFTNEVESIKKTAMQSHLNPPVY